MNILLTIWRRSAAINLGKNEDCVFPATMTEILTCSVWGAVDNDGDEEGMLAADDGGGREGARGEALGSWD